MAKERYQSSFEEFINSRGSKRDKPLPSLAPQGIYEQLDRYVIGQHRAKKKIALAAYNHIKRIKFNRNNPEYPLQKSNILLYGPTGCGKTHLARTLARVLDFPIVLVDATDYTEAGYYGKDVETIIGELLLKTGSVEEAQCGIVFIDEIDKIATRRGGMRNGAGNRDIGGEGVQQALLKLLEGKTIFAPTNVTQHWNRHDFVPVNVSDILFVCSGAFSDLDYYRVSTVQGFTGERIPVDEQDPTITLEQFQKYGFMPEFLGRLPIRVGLKSLTSSELIDVLTLPPDSILSEYRRLLEADGITLTVEREAYEPIVEAVEAKRMGARSLRTIMEEILEEIMFRAPELRGKKINLTKSMVNQRLESLNL
ncbi:MAG TPA: AAA family ATPase [Spirochaetia bacterium]|nr:AAA family ATPase [Spirochaetia bacterium]